MRLMENGLTQTEIGREYGVSRQYVCKLAKQGGHVNKFRIIGDNLPWEVHRDFVGNGLYKNLRRHGIAMAFGYDSLGRSDQEHLRSLYRKLVSFNVVVDYDPGYPALPGVANTPGFAFVPRLKKDKNFVIKLRPGVNLTKEGRKLWRLPLTMPDGCPEPRL